MSLAEDLLNTVADDGSSLGNVLRWDGDTTKSERLPGTNLWRVSTQAMPVENLIGSKLQWSDGSSHTITVDDIEDLRSVDLEVDGNGDATIQGEPMLKVSCALSGTEEVHMVIVTESYISGTLIKRGVYLLKTSSGLVEAVTTDAEIFDSNASTGGTIYYDNEPHIIVGSDRFITVPQELKRLGVQWDHNIETVRFDCPRYWDNHDMSRMKVYINYIRADKRPGLYPVDGGVIIDTIDDTIMHFDWTISREVTETNGNIVFLVCVKSVDEEGNEKEHWNSELCKDCYISEGLEAGDPIINQYPDVITHTLTRLDLLDETIKQYITDFLTNSETLDDMITQYIDAKYSKESDKTLTVDGGFADAKVVGDKFKTVQDDVDAINSAIPFKIVIDDNAGTINFIDRT